MKRRQPKKGPPAPVSANPTLDARMSAYHATVVMCPPLGTPSPSLAREKNADRGLGTPGAHANIPGFCQSTADTTSIILTLPPAPRSTRYTSPGLVVIARIECCLSCRG